MSGLYIQSAASAGYAGVFAIDVAPPTIVLGTSLGFVGFVGQFAWGPVQSVQVPPDGPSFTNMFEPAGSPRSSTGYYAIRGRKNLSLKVVRPLGSGNAAATATIAGTGGGVHVGALYPGTLGNSIVVTLAAAASGVTTQRDITVSLTNAVTGTTSKTYSSVPLPVGGIGVTVSVAGDLLIASLTVDGAMTVWPANGATNLSGGSNGAALGTSDYVGTQGSTDKGCALFEAQPDVRVVCHDDCGDTNRSAISQGFVSHAEFMGDRRAVVDGNPDVADWPTAKSELTGALIDERCIFVQSWTTILDDAGNPQQSPWSTFIASVLTNFGPQYSHSWWDDSVTDYYAAAQSIVANFAVMSSGVKTDAFALGICLPIQLPSGRFAMQHDRNANATNPARRYVTRGRTEDYIALSIQPSLRSYTNGPITQARVTEQVTLVNTFLDGLTKPAPGEDAPILNGYSINTKNVNNSTTLAAGQLFIGIAAQNPAPQEQTFLLLQVGPTVQVTVGTNTLST